MHSVLTVAYLESHTSNSNADTTEHCNARWQRDINRKKLHVTLLPSLNEEDQTWHLLAAAETTNGQ